MPNEDIAFAVIVENSGFGGSEAAPIIKKYTHKYFSKGREVKMSTLLDNRYELIERIGDGGMAEVYRAHDKMLDRFRGC